MSAPLRFDAAQAARFLSLLAGRDPVTLQTFSDREELKITKPDGTVFDPNAKIGHGTIETAADAAQLERLNAKGAGVYVMVNAGDGRGRTAKNVLRARALFIDTDGVPLPKSTPLLPHLMVQSSPGKFHLYWLVSGLELTDFSPLQQVLAEHYGTDLSVKDLPRVMRLPGFYHCKAEPVMVQLLESHDHPPYTPADIFIAWPFLPERLEQERQAEAEKERQRADILRRAAERKAQPNADTGDRARAKALLQAHHDTVASAGDGTRHETLKRGAYTLGGYIAGGVLEAHEVEDVLSAAAEVCGLPDGEAAEVIRWGLSKGAEKPLELPSGRPRMFGAKPSFGAKGCAPNLLRPSQPKPCLMQSGTYREGLGAKPLLGGKPCL